MTAETIGAGSRGIMTGKPLYCRMVPDLYAADAFGNPKKAMLLPQIYPFRDQYSNLFSNCTDFSYCTVYTAHMDRVKSVKSERVLK